LATHIWVATHGFRNAGLEAVFFLSHFSVMGCKTFKNVFEMTEKNQLISVTVPKNIG